MDLSIIIVNWNTRELLRGCLASLPAAWGELNCEVLVVDNASRDDSAAMVRNDFPQVRLLEGGANLGFSRGNNLALPQAAGRFVLLLNPDTVCPAGSLARLVDFAQDQDRLGVVGPLLTTAAGEPTITYGFFPRTRFHWLGFLDPLRILPFAAARRRVVQVPARSQASRPVDYVAGACFLMPRAALEAVGLLDEAFFMYFEETDWCYRARALGLDTWYCADTEIVHLEGQAAGIVSRFSLEQLQKSYRQFTDKHYGPGSTRHFRAAQFAEYTVKAALRALVPANRRQNKALAAMYWARALLQLRPRIDVTPPR